jgi:hypothetical protein
VKVGIFLLVLKTLKKYRPLKRSGNSLHTSCGARKFMVLENFWKVVSLLATCRKTKQGGDEGGERRTWEDVLSHLFPLFIIHFKK